MTFEHEGATVELELKDSYDLYYELPEEIVDLDTGKRYMAAITAKWVEA